MVVLAGEAPAVAAPSGHMRQGFGWLTVGGGDPHWRIVLPAVLVSCSVPKSLVAPQASISVPPIANIQCGICGRFSQSNQTASSPASVPSSPFTAGRTPARPGRTLKRHSGGPQHRALPCTNAVPSQRSGPVVQGRSVRMPTRNSVPAAAPCRPPSLQNSGPTPVNHSAMAAAVCTRSKAVCQIAGLADLSPPATAVIGHQPCGS